MGSFVSNRMVDPLLQNPDFNDNIDPAEIQKTLMGFLGQTYSEISKYDNHLVSTNQFLAPKKQEFQRTAEQVIREVSGGIQPHPAPVVYNQHRPAAVPFIDTNTAPPPPPPSDPNQMEFSFDNSITAKTINSKLDEIEKRIKKLDTVIRKVLSYIESHDTKDTKQE